jgi:arsenite-transporting ATPase
MEFLRETVRFVLVTIPEALAVEQLDATLAEMSKYGFRVEMLVVNNVVKDIGGSVFLQTRAKQQQHYLSLIHSKYSHLQILEIPLFPQEIIGVERLRLIERHLFPRTGTSDAA